MRADDDEAHSKRLRSHEETLTTIREGGAIKLKAEKDAAAVKFGVAPIGVACSRHLSPNNPAVPLACIVDPVRNTQFPC